jgi:hypothetical protein
MSRLVVPYPKERGLAAGPQQAPDSLTGRVAKYAPVESVGFFVAVKAAVEGLAPADARWYLIFAAVLCLVVSPIYFLAGFRDRSRLVRATHATISVLAFAVWAYALAGDTMVPEWYKPILAALLLPTFSYLVGAIAKLTGEY